MNKKCVVRYDRIWYKFTQSKWKCGFFSCKKKRFTTRNKNVKCFRKRKKYLISLLILYNDRKLTMTSYDFYYIAQERDCIWTAWESIHLRVSETIWHRPKFMARHTERDKSFDWVCIVHSVQPDQWPQWLVTVFHSYFHIQFQIWIFVSNCAFFNYNN